MGNCQGLENKKSKIFLLAQRYPRFHGGKVDPKIIDKNENELWEHYQKFIQYKQAMKKSDPTLYDYFFNPIYNQNNDEDSEYEISVSFEQEETEQSENKNEETKTPDNNTKTPLKNLILSLLLF